MTALGLFILVMRLIWRVRGKTSHEAFHERMKNASMSSVMRSFCQKLPSCVLASSQCYGWRYCDVINVLEAQPLKLPKDDKVEKGTDWLDFFRKRHLIRVD